MRTKTALDFVAAALMLITPLQAQTSDSVTAPVTTAPAISASAADIVRMSEAGTGEEVLLAYIKISTTTFDLSADQILYLRDIGLSSSVIAGMLNRDAALRSVAGVNPPQYAQSMAPLPNDAPIPAPAPAVNTVEPAPAPVYASKPPAEVSYFYDQLSPYGTWVQLEGVGWCWQPRAFIINHNWRPYCDAGNWVYTDAGWCWQSDYSWGWAPFHYGRWYLDNGCGWVWTPDRVWGPAWVTWRVEGDHCGWAPLPPHAGFDFRLGLCFNGSRVGMDLDFRLRPERFTFIALPDFHESDYARCRLPSVQVTQIYNHSTVINNYLVNNNTIVNHGIQVDRVAAATHREVHPLAIRDVPTRSLAATQSAVGRAELPVYRPRVAAPARPVNAVAQRIDAAHRHIQPTPIASPCIA